MDEWMDPPPQLTKVPKTWLAIQERPIDCSQTLAYVV
jgi:hypothetical protein